MRRYLPTCSLPVPAPPPPSAPPCICIWRGRRGAGSTLIIRLFLIERSPSVRVSKPRPDPVCASACLAGLSSFGGAWSVRKFHLLLVQIFAACVLKCLWQQQQQQQQMHFLPPFRCGKVAIGGKPGKCYLNKAQGVALELTPKIVATTTN